MYELTVSELSEGMSEDLRDEPDKLVVTTFGGYDDAPEPQLRVAQAQLVGWQEGLIAGMQATVLAQQLADQAQLVEVQQPLATASQSATRRAATSSAKGTNGPSVLRHRASYSYGNRARVDRHRGGSNTLLKQGAPSSVAVKMATRTAPGLLEACSASEPAPRRRAKRR
jgi:hypothetical protein